MKKVILASSSPRRIEILSWLGIPFDVAVPNVDELAIRDEDAVKLCRKLAKTKAQVISKSYKDGLIIGTDTIVKLGKLIIEKPINKKDQRRLIKLQNGKIMEIISGVYVVDASTGKSMIRTKKTKFKMKKISDKLINFYIKSGQGVDKGGGFGIQDENGMFVENITGCYTNAIGFPICTVAKILENFGVPIKQNIKILVKEKTGYSC
jgi:septum formation protein